MCDRKDIVDIIVNILQILTLRQGTKQLLGKKRESEQSFFNDEQEIKRLKKMLWENTEEEEFQSVKKQIDFEYEDIESNQPLQKEEDQSSLLYVPNTK